MSNNNTKTKSKGKAKDTCKSTDKGKGEDKCKRKSNNIHKNENTSVILHAALPDNVAFHETELLCACCLSL